MTGERRWEPPSKVHCLLLFALLGLIACSPKPEREPQATRPKAGTRAHPPPKPDVRKKPKDAPVESGRWHKSRTRDKNKPLADWQLKQMEQLEAIGYMTGSVPARRDTGVRSYQKKAAMNGLNFYTSGHGPTAILMDMEGNELHTWSFDFAKAFARTPVAKAADTINAQFWRRAHLFENGDVLAIFEGFGLIKIDRDSNLIFANPCRAHHDLEVLPNGDIYVLTRKAKIIEKYDATKPILEDYVSVLGPDGTLRKNVSLLAAMERSAFAKIWNDTKKKTGDIFHTNTLSILDGSIASRQPAFSEGRILTSFLMLSTIAVLDLEQEMLVWVHRGDYRRQHDPQIVSNGNLLLFDNKGHAAKSRIIEYDPATMKKVWTYQGTPKSPFYSAQCGAAQRLPNGNTLISETDNGRAFEVTPKGDIVWEFSNPRRAGKNGEYIAALFEVIRLDTNFPTDWI